MNSSDVIGTFISSLLFLFLDDGEKTGCAPFAWNMLACCGWGRPRGTEGKMENKNNFKVNKKKKKRELKNKIKLTGKLDFPVLFGGRFYFSFYWRGIIYCYGYYFLPIVGFISLFSFLRGWECSRNSVVRMIAVVCGGAWAEVKAKKTGTC